MNQAQFVQIPCVKCGTIVWIAPAAGVGYCPSCHTPNQLPAGAVAGAPPGGAPAPYGAPPGAPGAPPQGPGGYGVPPGAPPPVAMMAPQGMRGAAVQSPGGGATLKAVGGAVLAIVAGLAYAGVKLFLPKRGIESVSNLGIDKKKADPDKMIAGAAAYAKKWKSDAGFWSVNILALGADGTVDLTSSNVVVEYFSPGAISSVLPSTRDDSIKKFNFIDGNMQYKDVWGVRKQYNPPPHPTPIPSCTAKMLAATLVKQGILKTGASLHVSIAPEFSDAWIVQTPSKPLHFDSATCTQRN